MVMSETVVRRMATTLQTTMRPCCMEDVCEQGTSFRVATFAPFRGKFLALFTSSSNGTESRPSQVLEAGQRGVDEESDDQKEDAAMDGDAQTLLSIVNHKE